MSALMSIAMTLACRPQRAPAALVKPEAWVWTEASEDPSGDRPASVSCDEDAWYPEAIGLDESLAVDTLDCDYLAVHQPLLADVLEGDGLFVRLWHYELSAPEPTSAHWALHVGDALLYEETLDIPAESGMSAPEWTAERDYAAGEAVYFHLHNHGANSYNLIELSVIPPE